MENQTNQVVQTILTRSSIRKYKEQEISEEKIRSILEAGMSGPSCVNARDWAFIVVRDRDVLNRMADVNGGPAEPLRKAAFGILICGDLERAFEPAKDYFVIDCAIAGQNMVLAAESMGIGSVWLGTWPQMERVENQSKLFGLPEYIVPHSVIAFGYPDEEKRAPQHWDDSRVHYDKW